MAGTLTVDTIQSDSSYTSRINVASPLVMSNGTVTGTVNFSNNTLRVDSVNGVVGIGRQPAAGYYCDVNGLIRSTGAGFDASLILQNTGTGGKTWNVYSTMNSFAQGGGRFMVYHTDAGGQYQLGVDSAGRVTMPLQPAFSAYRNANQTGNPFVITYNGTTFNIGSHFNASTGLFTAPITGTYMFCFTCIGPTATSWNDIYGWKNGAINTAIFCARPNSSNQADSFGSLGSASLPVQLTAGDTFGLYCSNANLYSDGNNWVKFAGYLIG